MSDDRDFLVRLESAALLPAEWNHPAQLRMTYLHLRGSHFQDAIPRIRRALRRVHCGLGGAFGDFHETWTLAWSRLVASRIDRERPAPCWFDFIRGNRDLLDSALIEEHYSSERIHSPRARREFVLPDRKPLPVGFAAKSWIPPRDRIPLRNPVEVPRVAQTW